MTNKEAIECLRCNFYNMESCRKEECNQHEAIEMAIEALAAQVPMKPIIAHETDYDVRHYLCPICDEWVSVGVNYCYECGQAIDWSRKNEMDL